MKNWKILLVVSFGAILFSSCSKGYGCYYSQNELSTPVQLEQQTEISLEVVATQPPKISSAR